MGLGKGGVKAKVRVRVRVRVRVWERSSAVSEVTKLTRRLCSGVRSASNWLGLRLRLRLGFGFTLTLPLPPRQVCL